MKAGVSSYSFAQMLRSGQIKQFDLIAKAKELGFEGIEFVDMPDFGAITVDNAHILREEADKQGMAITSFTFGAELLRGNTKEALDQEVEAICKKVDVAAALGVKVLRHDASGGGNLFYRTFDDALPVLAEGCRRVTEYAQTKGVRTTIENHGRFCQDALRVEKLVHAVNHPNFGLLVDMGNFLCADNEPSLAVGICARYAFHVHIKDFIVKSGHGVNPGTGFFATRGGNYLRGTIAGHGDVPILACLRALKAAGYDGFVSLEFEGCEPNEYALKVGGENIKRFLSLI